MKVVFHNAISGSVQALCFPNGKVKTCGNLQGGSRVTLRIAAGIKFCGRNSTIVVKSQQIRSMIKLLSE